MYKRMIYFSFWLLAGTKGVGQEMGIVRDYEV